jgi:hypothetical protein
VYPSAASRVGGDKQTLALGNHRGKDPFRRRDGSFSPLTKIQSSGPCSLEARTPRSGGRLPARDSAFLIRWFDSRTQMMNLFVGMFADGDVFDHSVEIRD